VDGETGCWGTAIARLCTNDEETNNDDETTDDNDNKDNICSSLGIDVDVNNDGTIIVAGEPGYDGNKGIDIGRVRIYQRSSGSTKWTETVINGKEAGQLFGTSVAVSEYEKGWIAVTSFGSDDKGRVDMFKYDGETWKESGSFDDLGFSVDLSGGDGGQDSLRVVIGDHRKKSRAGITEVYEYENSDQSWKLISKFFGNEKEELGYSVALSNDGNTMLAGAPANEKGNGIVYIYNLSSGDLTRITGEDEEQLGASVAVNKKGNVIAVGAPSYDKNVGRVRAYSKSGSLWIRKGNGIKGSFSGARIGNSNTISISNEGDRLAIGSDSVNNNDKLGEVRIFDFDKKSNEWDQIKKIDGKGNDNVDTVALSDKGKTIAIGAPGAKDCAGQVRVFDEVCKD